MSTATKPVAVRELLRLAETEEYFLLSGVSWEKYKKFVDDLGERRVFVSYDRGELEFMTVSARHDRRKSYLDKFIFVMFEEFSINFEFGGSFTMQRKDLLRGMEADESYWTTNAAKVRGRDEVDLTVDPPPDLILEIEESRSIGRRLGICAALRIPEVWRLAKKTLTVGLLQPNGEYAWGERSLTFPTVPIGKLFAFCERAKKEDLITLMREFRGWLQQFKK